MGFYAGVLPLLQPLPTDWDFCSADRALEVSRVVGITVNVKRAVLSEMADDQAKKEALERLLSASDAPVNLISTPFSVETGAALAQAIKCENHNPPQRFCYNPNTDAPQDAGGGWLQSWIKVCQHTKKTAGTVFIVHNAQKDGAYGTGEHRGCFDGQAQQGELELATLLRCNIEWKGYTRDREAEARAEQAAEQRRIAAGGCEAGGEHEWQYHQGKDGTGRACFKCLEVHDLATGNRIWWCGSKEERHRILTGGCPPGGQHIWSFRGDGRCCDRCGFTETTGGAIKLLPQLLGAFGPPKANPRIANQ